MIRLVTLSRRVDDDADHDEPHEPPAKWPRPEVPVTRRCTIRNTFKADFRILGLFSGPRSYSRQKPLQNAVS